MLRLAQQPPYEASTTHNELSATMMLFSIKSQHNTSNRCFNDVVHLMQETAPTTNRIPLGFNAIEKKVKELELDYKSIHRCHNGCMIYCKEDAHLLVCKFCGTKRFKKRQWLWPTKSCCKSALHALDSEIIAALRVKEECGVYDIA